MYLVWRRVYSGKQGLEGMVIGKSIGIGRTKQKEKLAALNKALVSVVLVK
jgi:hypothetical protein